MAYRNRVAEVRRRRGYSQLGLARKAGIARQTLVTIEANPAHRATPAVVERLAEALGDKPGSLFWFEPEVA